MPTYQKAPREVVTLMQQTMAKYHGDLVDAGVTVDLLAAAAKLDKNGELTGPAVKHQGYACAAKARICTPKERAAGRADTEIVIDYDQWTEFDTERQVALLDHELNHFELKLDEKNQVERDDLDRPKMKCRLHDVQCGWFHCIVERHGKDSLEYEQFKNFFDGAYKQLWLPGIEEKEKTA